MTILTIISTITFITSITIFIVIITIIITTNKDAVRDPTKHSKTGATRANLTCYRVSAGSESAWANFMLGTGVPSLKSRKAITLA